MLHVFHLDVVKIDRDVAHVASRRGKQAQARAVPTERHKRAAQRASSGRPSECPGTSNSIDLGQAWPCAEPSKFVSEPKHSAFGLAHRVNSSITR